MTRPGPRRTLPAGVLPASRSAHGEEAGSHVRPKAPPPTQERAAPRADSRATPSERAQRLVTELVSLGPDRIAPVIRKLIPLGHLALEEIARRFPEPLWDRPALADRLPRPDEISSTACALWAFQDEALPYLTELLHHPRSTVRYHAMAVCAGYSNDSLVAPLAAASLDPDHECRRAAVHLLHGYRRNPAYPGALGLLGRHATRLTNAAAHRRRAISALTQLRDETSVSLLVDLLADSDRSVASAARVGLRVLTTHDFGFSREPWLRWLSDRGHCTRTEWLIEGLGDARTNIRVLASKELWAATRLFHPLSEGDARDAFLEAQRRYEHWRMHGSRS